MPIRAVIGVVIALAVTACSRGSTVSSPVRDSTLSTSASTTTSPTLPTPAPPVDPEPIALWKVVGEAASVPATAPPTVFCHGPDPPAPCNRIEGSVAVGSYGTSRETLSISIHLAPLSWTDEQFVTNIEASSIADVTAATTAAGRSAWVVEGSNRGGVFRFLVARLSDAVYASVLQWCGPGACPSPFPLDRARLLVADLEPTRVKLKLVRWLGQAYGGYRTLRIPNGDRACDRTEQYWFADPDRFYRIAEKVVTPPQAPIDAAGWCSRPGP